jgi:7,8-dihydropterin-6-yl-methyl-4-(beta-D-ribofuranosyl)aminobenzene 5'-phosphate synthase
MVKEIESLSISCVVDNYYDALMEDPPCGRRFRTKPYLSIYAEHGLSFYVVAKREDRSYSLFFDFGVDGDLLLHNLKVLGIDPQKLDALVLSHGHFDHYGGLKALLKRIYPRSIPLYLGKGAFTRRFSERKGEGLTDLGKLEKEELEKMGAKIRESDSAEEILPGVYLTGLIEMKTPYEKIPETLLLEREGKIERDLFEEERALFFSLKDKGLVILSGCAHRGIVNTIREVIKLTGTKKIHAIIGGFHLMGASSERILNTIQDLKALSPSYLIPMHCTGLEASLLFSRMMGKSFILNTVGTIYEF